MGSAGTSPLNRLVGHVLSGQQRIRLMARLESLASSGEISVEALVDMWQGRSFGLRSHEYPAVPSQLRADDGLHEMHEAAIKGDASQLADVLSQGLDANLADDRGATALMHACLWGQDQAVMVLCTMGADTEIKTPPSADPMSGGTALCFACMHGPRALRPQGVRYDASRQLRIVVFLLSCGAQLTAETTSGFTAPMLAEKAGDPEIIRVLRSVTAAVVGTTALPSVAAPPPNMPPETDPAPKPPTRTAKALFVRLHGLQSQPALNGKIGEVVPQSKNAERIGVKIFPSGDVKLLKKENCETLLASVYGQRAVRCHTIGHAAHCMLKSIKRSCHVVCVRRQ